jgi:UDP-glucose 4-epimerase
MKILITGKSSYIGNSVKSWLNKTEPHFLVHEISLRNIELSSISFKSYEVIIHVAGIAHISTNKKFIPEYFKINRDLAIEVAIKAKEEGVKQFIFISSIAIYGDDMPIGNFKPIDTNQPTPTNAYGQSKLEADLEIQKLQNNLFNASILRIPMVYGKSAKGNFLKLINLSRKLSFFPKIKNNRSVLNIKNLSELVRLVIINNLHGLFYAQDNKYFETNDFVLKYRDLIGKKTIFFPFLGLLFKTLGFFIKPINKLYGNKYYEQSLSKVENINYQIYSIDDFIKDSKGI